jgi:hypothetical protein
MAVAISGERALYAVEAVVILLALPALLFWPIPILPAIPGIAALVLAIIGVVRPRFFAPVGLTDPKRPLRLYLHVCAVICCVPAFVMVLAMLGMIVR